MNPSIAYGGAVQDEPIVFSLDRTGSMLGATQAIALLVSFLLIYQPRDWFSTLPSALVVWSTAGILLWLAIVAFLVVKAQGQNPWLHALSLTMMYVFFRYGWGALVVFYWDRFPWQAIPYLRSRFEAYGMRANLENSCQLVLLCGLGLFLGLSTPLSRVSALLPAARWPIDEQRFRAKLVLYTPVGLFITIALRYSLPLSLQNLVSTVGWVVNPLIAVASYWLFTERDARGRLRLSLFLLFAVGAAEIAGLRTGMVQEFVYPLLAVVWGYILARDTLPWKAILLAAAPAAFLAPWVTVYKNVAPLSTSMPILDRVSETNERLRLMSARAALEVTLDRFVARASGPPLASVFLQYYPIPYSFTTGRTFLLELEALVPRLLWPGKPEIMPELNRYTARVGMIQEDSGTSAGFDAPTEYYVNFGMIGVLAFSLLHGMYLSVLYEWLVLRSHYLIGGSIFAVLISMNLDFFGVVQLVTAHLHIIPVWLLVFYFLSCAPKLRRVY